MSPERVSMLSHVATQAVGLSGVAAFLAGVHQVHEPSALISGGVLAVVWAVLKTRAEHQ